MLKVGGDEMYDVKLSVFKEVDRLYHIRPQFNNLFTCGDSENQFVMRYSSYNINEIKTLFCNCMV